MTQMEICQPSESQVTTAANAHAKAIELGKHILRMTTASGSGHPSSALSLVHVIVELMYRQMRYDLANPWNLANDRLVLSIGHAVPVVYAAYADLGGVVGRSQAEAKPLAVEDLASLRELHSVLDGHPNPAEGFPFFDAATGSLGQGLSVATGLALAAKMDHSDRRIFVVMGDGEAREGQVWEAADFAVDHKLDNICAFVSCNGHGQAAAVSAQQSSDAMAAKMKAFGWHVLEIDGHDPNAISNALAQFGKVDRPLAVIARTVKGWGVDMMLGKNFHGKPLPKADLEQGCAQLDETGNKLNAQADASWKPTAPSETVAHCGGESVVIAPFEAALKRVGLDTALEKKKLATRVAYGAALVALGDTNPRVVALDGDVSNSTFSNMFAEAFPDRFFECKIAEQNMVSAAAGLAAADKIPFASSFAKFIARANDQIDLAAISRANIKIVGSHSGVSLGADGPSQMSVSDVTYFRSLTRVSDGRGGIGCHVFQPSDPISAYRLTELMANIDGLCYLRTHRPETPFLYNFDETFEVGGCKQLRDGSDLVLVSAGYMLHTVLDVADQLKAAGKPCAVFDAYTLPLDADPILNAAKSASAPILVVEDNYVGGLHAELAEAAAVSADVRVIGMAANRIPKSAKSAAQVFDWVGVGLEQILSKAKELIAG